MTTLPITHEARINRARLAMSAFLITTFLFYIDEGHYNFKWMADFWNWVIFFIYGLAILMGQLLFHEVVFKSFSFKGKTTLTMIFGALFAIGGLVTFIFS